MPSDKKIPASPKFPPAEKPLSGGTRRGKLIPAKFWMVFRYGGDVPYKIHSDSKSASAEAQRLCEKHPGEYFYVLESTHFKVKMV